MTDFNLTPEQLEILGKLATGEVSMTDPGAREALGHLTADDFQQAAERMTAQHERHEALTQASHERLTVASPSSP